MGTCGNTPAGNTDVDRMPNSSYSRRMVRTEPTTSLGSKMAPEAMKRSGCRLSASRAVSSETPTIPFSMPNRSISCSVTEIGSSAGSSLGTSLNMYSTGNSRFSLDSRSLVCLRMKSYCSKPSLREADHGVDHRQSVWSGHCHSDLWRCTQPARFELGQLCVLAVSKRHPRAPNSETMFSFLSTTCRQSSWTIWSSYSALASYDGAVTRNVF